jgi:hypothetical protein
VTFQNPWGLLGLLATVPVIVLYFLKLKRTKVTVSSTWLWQRSIQDLRVNAPFQKLRKNLLLFIQLLLIIIASIAFARPAGSPLSSSGKGVVILIDRSASMTAKDVAPSRLDEAKRQSKELVRALQSGDQVMVISFSRKAEVVLPFSTDRRQIESAIDSVRPSSMTTRIGEAFQMALSAVKTFKTSELVIFSDGQFEEISAPNEGVPVKFVAIGGRINNVAVTALDVRRPQHQGEPWTVFAQLDCFSAKPMDVPVELYVNTKLAKVKQVPLDPNSAHPVIFEIDQPPEIVELKVAAEDDLEVDNRAWLAVRHKDYKVLLVSSGNFFLEKALLQAPHVSVDRVTPDRLTSDTYIGYDMVVFDAVAPASVPSEGRYLYLGALPAWEGIKATGAIEHPVIVDWDRRHRVTRFINFSGITIKTAPKLELPGTATVLAEAQEGPLIFAWQKERLRAVVVGYKLFESDWPLRLSFPIMMVNALEWLRADDLAEWRGHPTPGDSIYIRLDQKETFVHVRWPDGKESKLEGKPGEEVAFTETQLPGVYVIKRGNLEEPRALNLLDPNESSGRVADKLKLGEETVKAAEAIPPARHEGWRLFAWIALIILLAEWWIYHRRIEIF